MNIVGIEREQLRNLLNDIGEPGFRAQQIFKWIYQSNVKDFDSMRNLSKSCILKLKQQFKFDLPSIAHINTSQDGTKKFLIRLHDGNNIETVFIPETNRGTLCISSQVGCALNCTFCATGAQGFNRNLSASEVISQLWLVDSALKQDPNYGAGSITNVVMMGMGEPLLNLAAVLPALKIMLDDFAYGLSKRRVTVSTSGVAPKIYELFEDCDVALALSLHAPTDDLRTKIIPLNKKHNIAEVLQACKSYLAFKRRKKHVMIEYVMLNEVNDFPEHAHQLYKLLKGMSVKINLIPFNTFVGTQFTSSTKERILRFKNILKEYGMVVTIRVTRGEDSSAACGQLAGDFKNRVPRKIKLMYQTVEPQPLIINSN